MYCPPWVRRACLQQEVLAASQVGVMCGQNIYIDLSAPREPAYELLAWQVGDVEMKDHLRPTSRLLIGGSEILAKLDY